MKLNLFLGAIGISLLATSAFAAGMGGGHGGGGMGGGRMGGGGVHAGGGMHPGEGFHSGAGTFAGRGLEFRRGYGARFVRRGGYGLGGYGVGGYGYDGDGDYGYNDPAYGYGENGDGLQSSRSAAEGGNVCETPRGSCQLDDASYVGLSCSCRKGTGSVRGRVVQ